MGVRGHKKKGVAQVQAAARPRDAAKQRATVSMRDQLNGLVRDSFQSFLQVDEVGGIYCQVRVGCLSRVFV